MTNTTWLPNLVAGVSIWKLAPDLNEPKFFDGRLLVPETEGSDSLPTKVTWNVAGLVPLAEARVSYPADVAAAMRDFLACVERVGQEFANPQSGYSKFKSAFTVPALAGTAPKAGPGAGTADAAADANYFYSPREKKLVVVNWGASPRDLSRKEEFIYGYADFAQFLAKATPVETSSVPMPAAAPVAAVAAAAAAVNEKQEEPAKPEEEEKKKGRPWWHWALLGLLVLAIIALVMWLLQQCGRDRGGALGPDAGDGAVLADASDDGAASGDEAGVDAGAASDAAAVLDGSAADDAGDAGDAGEWHDGGAVRLPDGGVRVKLIGPHGKTKTIVVVAGAGGGGGGGGKGGGGGAGADGDDDKGQPHRSHFQPDAVRWRVAGGLDQLDPQSPHTGEGPTFDVTLRPGGSFGSVKVQWQDKNGRWHN